MKKLLFFSLLLSSAAVAQSISYDYLLNQNLLNPAFGSFSDRSNMIFSGGKMPFSPIRFSNNLNFGADFYINHRLNQKNSVELIYEQELGIKNSNTSGVAATYAHNFNFKNGRKLGLGTRLNFNTTSGQFPFFNSYIIRDSYRLASTFGVGYDSKNFVTGLALETSPYFESKNIYEMGRMLTQRNTFLIGTKHNIGKQFKIKPSFTAFYNYGVPIRLDFNFNAELFNRIALISSTSFGSFEDYRSTGDILSFGTNVWVYKDFQVGFLISNRSAFNQNGRLSDPKNNVTQFFLSSKI